MEILLRFEPGVDSRWPVLPVRSGFGSEASLMWRHSYFIGAWNAFEFEFRPTGRDLHFRELVIDVRETPAGNSHFYTNYVFMRIFFKQILPVRRPVDQVSRSTMVTDVRHKLPFDTRCLANN